MNDIQSPKIRQEDELLSLQSIFDDVVDLRKKSSNEWEPLILKISIKPEGNEIYVSCDLYTECGPSYPITTIQKISILNCKGLSNDLKKKLEERLMDIAYKNKGNEVIYLLVNSTREFLTELNEPGPKSVYDQMVSNNKKLEEEKEREKAFQLTIARKNEETRNKHIQKEIQRKHSILKQENKLRELSKYQNDFFRSRRSNRSESSSNMFNYNCNILHLPIRLKFLASDSEAVEYEIIQGGCIFHDNWDNSTSYVGIDETTGSNLTITEWIFDLMHNEPGTGHFLQSFTTLEQLVQSLAPKLDNSKLIPILSFSYSIEKERMLARLLSPWIFGLRLSSLPSILNGISLNEASKRKISRDVLEALSFLHRLLLRHGDLRDTNIFIDLRSGDCLLFGAEVMGRISTLQKDTLFRETNSKSNEGRDEDISRFGILLLWLASDCKQLFANLYATSITNIINSFLPSLNLSNSHCDLISKCLLVNAITNIEQLQSHQYFLQKDTIENSMDYICKINKHVKIKENDKNSSNQWFSNLLEPIPGNSRLADYEILSQIGSGGFGEVFKVRHKLDQCFYALKKIPLTSSKFFINRKIIHEVKYLSRLNHENVVRYYGTWAESECTENHEANSYKIISNDNKVTSIDYSSDEELEEDKIFSISHLWSAKSNTDTEDYIVFESREKNSMDNAKVSENYLLKEQRQKEKNECIGNTVIYIQMELCENDTLRNAIDYGGLSGNLQRRRRLFREIVEGLVHIHEHGIIHRDLKPGNIFLDLTDHVKIGDFGLATKSEICPLGDLQTSYDNAPIPSDSGVVGTSFYIGPELKLTKGLDKGVKLIYTQKVDIYSLGIILFEMCYPPPKTNSERFKILNDLRKEEICFPGIANEILSNQEIELIRSLLRHNPNERPSSSELLKSPYLPPLQIEEEEQQNVLREVISNPQSKTHHFMLNFLFKRQSNLVEDFIYDFHEETNNRSTGVKRLFNNNKIRRRVFQYVCNTIENLLAKYGATKLNLPTFMPQYSAQKYDTEDVVRLLEHTGSIICPPYDLRVPFARYVARNKLANFRRYSIDKVYRERKMSYHPRELIECAFDIIDCKTSNSPLIISDADIICFLNDVINEFNCLKNKSFILRVNHLKLIKGLLTYYEVPDDKQNLAIKIIGEGFAESQKTGTFHRQSSDEGVLMNPARLYIQKRFLKENIADSTKINLIMNFLDSERDNVDELQSLASSYLRKRQKIHLKAAETVNESLQEMKRIIECININGYLNFKIKLSPSLVIGRYYSDIMFQLEQEITCKRNMRNVFAVGGRYDDLIEYFKMSFEEKHDEIRNVGVGTSLEIEKIVRSVIEDEYLNNSSCFGVSDVIISSREKSYNIFKVITNIAKELRMNQIKVVICSDECFIKPEDLYYYCADNHIKYCIMIDEVNQISVYARIFHIDAEMRITEKKCGNMLINEIVETIKYLISSKSDVISTDIKNNYFKSLPGDFCNYNTSTSMNIRFFPIEPKSLSATRKRLTFQIHSLLSSSFQSVNSGSVEIFALEVSFKIIKSIVADIDFDENLTQSSNSKNAFDQTVRLICDKNPRHRAYLSDVLEKMYLYKNEKKGALIILLSYVDMHFILMS